MADNDNSAPPEQPEDLRIRIATILFECRLGVEAVALGLRTLELRAAEPIKSEIGVLLRLADQAGEAFEALSGVLGKMLEFRRGLNS